MAADEIAAVSGLQRAKGHERFLFVACFIALVATAFAFVTRAFIIGDLQKVFNLTETQKGEILGAGLWPFGISIVLFSLVVDKIGYGKSMIFAFACHVASPILYIFAKGYWGLYLGSFLCGLAAGTVEAIINPVVATMYPRSKTKMLTLLHAGWAGGVALGGVLTLASGAVGGAGWQVKVALLFIPTAIYGVMMLWCRFPVHERVVAGVPYRDMLKEAGAIGWLIVLYMIGMEVNKLVGLPTIAIGSYFSIPSISVSCIIGLLVLAYLLYTGSLGRLMYIFLLLVMILLAITELGTDGWMKELRDPAMQKLGMDGGWILVYTATLMMVLRLAVAPIVKVLKPLGILFISSLLAAAGLYLLSDATTAWIILVTATVYGVGQAYFWPATLGVIAERFPKGGALTLNAIAGVGMLGVGIIGFPLMGYLQDKQIEDRLKSSPAVYQNVVEPDEKISVLGKYKPIDFKKAESLHGQDKELVEKYAIEAKQIAMARIAVLPLIMAACYLGLIGYFRLKGGYKVVELTAQAEVSGERKPKSGEEAADEAATPTE
ncbi:MAG TPA: MFS transporter [Phycisphaerae bacterium]|nr:MFS transporter [Phycisphaerae bacterium]